jgi:presequence protease
MSHDAFDEVEQRFIDTLDLTLRHYVHRATGAQHYHLETDNDENVFLLALRTMPEDSTGVAHILEHTALCGSERFPVRDPFFLMIRRSLNTFMNAFTGSDYTAYPFASQNRNDYFNLLDIYLDAVFFSRLDPLDFAQEGHRLEFEIPDDPSSDLVYKGIVYNEMKGDSSSPISYLYGQLQKHLFPSTTYHHNSGGDPIKIPDLEYADLQQFYRTHYHPSNAVFMTFGNIPVEELQQRFENAALSRFGASQSIISAGKESRFASPLRVVEPYPVEPADNSSRSHVVMGWLLGESTDLDMLLRCHLLSDVLLDTSASPLRFALEQTELGEAVSPLSGLEESNREMSFMCGLEGCDETESEAIEALVINTLQDISKNGIAVEQLQSALHQLELSQREIGGDGTPYGLQLIFSCLPAAIHRGDPAALLDLDPVLERLRQEILQPQFVEHLVNRLLLENPHRLTLVLAPDEAMAKRELDKEREKLRVIKAGLGDTGAAVIVDQAARLAERQQQEEDLEVLPKVGLEDIGLPATPPVSQSSVLPGGTPLTRYVTGTNGISYHQLVAELPSLSARECQLLPLYTSLMTEVGSAGRDYMQTQLLQYALTGGVNAFSAIRTNPDDTESYRAYAQVSAKTLSGKSTPMFQLLKDTWQQPDFQQGNRIRDLIKQLRVRRDSSITGNGHALAMSAAAARFRNVSALSHQLSGLSGLQHLRVLDDSLDDADGLHRLQADLAQIADRFQTMQIQTLLVSDSVSAEADASALNDIWRGSAPIESSVFTFEADPECQDVAYTTNTQVNFCAIAYPTVCENHPDAAALSVLAGVLRNGYLHPVIREQGGAYGGGAMHDNSNGIFRMYSFRDPNLMSTFRAFDEAVDWLSAAGLSFSMVEESILGIVSGLDAPSSPAGEARQHFQNNLFGRTPESRRRYRENVLATREQDVLRVARRYLCGVPGRALITNQTRLPEIGDGFLVKSL